MTNPVDDAVADRGRPAPWRRCPLPRLRAGAQFATAGRSLGARRRDDGRLGGSGRVVEGRLVLELVVLELVGLLERLGLLELRSRPRPRAARVGVEPRVDLRRRAPVSPSGPSAASSSVGSSARGPRVVGHSVVSLLGARRGIAARRAGASVPKAVRHRGPPARTGRPARPAIVTSPKTARTGPTPDDLGEEPAHAHRHRHRAEDEREPEARPPDPSARAASAPGTASGSGSRRPCSRRPTRTSARSRRRRLPVSASRATQQPQRRVPDDDHPALREAASRSAPITNPPIRLPTPDRRSRGSRRPPASRSRLAGCEARCA